MINQEYIDQVKLSQEKIDALFKAVIKELDAIASNQEISKNSAFDYNDRCKINKLRTELQEMGYRQTSEIDKKFDQIDRMLLSAIQASPQKVDISTTKS